MHAPPHSSSRLNRTWQTIELLWRRSRILRIFAKNLLLTLLIEFVFLPAFGPLLGVSHLERGTLDLMMRFFSNTDRIQYRDIPAAFTLIDVDQDSMKAWNDPLFIPRDKILALAQASIQNGARIVILDFNFSRSYASLGDSYRTAENDLKNFLATQDLPDHTKSTTPILLLRSGNYDEQEASACAPAGPSFLDESTLSRNVQWTAARFDSDNDYILRDWRLFERVCSDDHPLVLPSVQLAVAANLQGTEGVAEMNRWLLQFRPSSCSGCSEEPTGLLGWRRRLKELSQLGEKLEPLRLGQIDISPGEEELEKHIVFRLPYMPRNERASYANVLVFDHSAKTSSQFTTTVLDEIPAAEFLNDTKHSSGRLNGRIVFIGTSLRESGDWFATPIGRMPGILVLINATYSLLEYGQFEEKSWQREVRDVLLIVSGMTVLFVFVRGFWGLLLSTLLLLVYLVPNSFSLFQQGRWLDVITPLIGVELHHLVDYVLERREHQRHKSEHEGKTDETTP